MKIVNYKYTDSKREIFNRRNKKIDGEIDLILFGDSITEGFNINFYTLSSKKILNSAIGGDRIKYMYMRLDDDVINLKPKSVLFMGGINDIRAWYENDSESPDEDYIINYICEYYEKIIKSCIDKKIEIVPCFILKGNEEKFNYYYLNIVIDKINEKLLNIFNKYNVEYVDYNEILVTDFNLLDRSISDDGLHPNIYGYVKMTDLLVFKKII